MAIEKRRKINGEKKKQSALPRALHARAHQRRVSVKWRGGGGRQRISMGQHPWQSVMAKSKTGGNGGVASAAKSAGMAWR
jgi:hypothetical protein